MADRSKERLAADSRRAQETRDELDRVQESAVALQHQTHELHARIDELNEEDRSQARDLTRAQAILEDEKAGIIELLRRTAQLHNEIASLDEHRSSLVSRRGELSQRDVVVADELRELVAKKTDLDRRLTEDQIF